MNLSKIRAGIIGGAGYTGGELLRILLWHPHVEISFVHSRSNVGNPVASIHQDLAGDTALAFTGDLEWNIDVLFLCLGHGESKKFLSENTVPEEVRIIDLANDFRLEADSRFSGRSFVYGLPEINRDRIRKATSIANPGCFATAIQLGLLPLAKAGILKEAHTTGITGSTGAGQSFSATSHFSWRANNIQAYKTLTHQHLGEIGQSLRRVNPGHPSFDVHFVPWRGDFTRGIFISSQVRCEETLESLSALYSDFYLNHPFVHLQKEPVHLKQVVNTNKCCLQLEKTGNMLVIHSAIDNLVKGASGQAVQNLNLMMGLPEDSGLQLKPTGF